MATPTQKVELGFSNYTAGNWFTLDSATRGVLDNATYVLSGATFVDVTSYVTNISASRGKNRQLDRFNAGRVNVQFNNTNRYFDPTFAASPFYGNIVPRRDIRISTNNIVQFTGVIDDWNLNYETNGISTAECVAYDGLSTLSKQTLAGGTATSQLSGARINAILDDSGVAWSATARLIDTGKELLQADVIPLGQNAISYINVVENTEPGIFFVDKAGNAVWKDRGSIVASSSAVVLSDDGTGIAYSAVRVDYGSELLYNQAELGRLNGGTAVGNDFTSQTTYGVRTLAQDGLLHATDAAIMQLAAWTVNQFSQPEFRFEAVEIVLNPLSGADQATILNLEIGSVCQIKFTPNRISPAISKYGEVIAISRQTTLNEDRITLGFQALDLGLFILDDTAFGLLDYNSLGY